MKCPRCDMQGPLAGRALPKHAEGCPSRSGRKRRQPELGSWWQTKALPDQTGGLPCVVSRATFEEVQFMMKHNSTEFVLPRAEFFDKYEPHVPAESLATTARTLHRNMNGIVHMLTQAFLLYMDEHPPKDEKLRDELKQHVTSLQQQAEDEMRKYGYEVPT